MNVSEHQTERTPGNQKKCPQCGVVLDAVVLFGLCPNCLLKQAFKEPSTIPGVELIEFIGRGGMGAVYKGRQYILNRIVAVKFMPPRAADGGSIIRRFEREAQLLARLNHPNVVAVYEFGLAGNFPYFTMDFVDGPSLRQILLKSGPLIPSEAVKLFLQLCDGLEHAHQFGVIHRDIKPENLLVDKKGILKIADFGLAKLNGGANASCEWQTSDGRPRGTLGYMAPEQILKPEAVDHRTDIYLAGAVLYEMLTGKPPLGRFPAPSQKAKVNSSLDAVLFKALEPDVARRYQDIRDFKQAVEAVVFNQNEPAQKMDRSDLESQRQRLAKPLQETPGDVHVWEQLKQICDQLNDDDGSILASRRLADIYWRQGRLAEAILEGQKLMLRLPKDSELFWEIKHQTHNLNSTLRAYEELGEIRPADYRFLQILKRSYAILDIDDKREYFTRKLAEAYGLKGKWPQAISEYRDLLQRHPGDDGIKKILSDLEERERQELDEAA
jgi:serine/threonine protein kinase